VTPSTIPRVVFDDRSARSPRTTGWERYSRSFLAALGQRVRLLELDAPTVAARLRTDWVTLPTVSARKDAGAAVLHLPTFPPTPVLRGPLVWTVHDLTWWLHRETSSAAGRRYYGPLAALAMRRRDAVFVTPSFRVRTEMLERFGMDEDRVVAAPLGVTSLPDRDPYEADRPYVLTVATLEPRKNLAYLLQAYERSKLRATHDLRIVGRQGWQAPQLANVQHMENVDDATLSSLYRGADALISPSVYEGFGLPLLEAMSLGVPVVCSDIPVYREVTGGLARYFSLDDVGDLVAALDGLTSPDRATSERLRAWSRRFTWAACVDHTERAYTKALEIRG
jgi:O-antigen biosynthesis alpha-1,2-mannosyltransferase